MKKSILLYLLIFQVSFVFAQAAEVAHEKNINLITFSPDNSLIITAGDDKTVKIWESATGKMQKSFKHSYNIKRIYISRSGSHMITGNGNFYHCLWSLHEGRAIRCFLDEQIAGFTPDGKYIVAIGYGNDGHKFANISLIDIESFERIDFPHKIPVDTLVHDLAITSDSKTFLIATGNKTVYVIDKNETDKKVKHKLKNETSWIALSPDNKHFVTEGSKHIYDVKTCKPVLELEEATQPSGISRLTYSNDGKLLLSVYNSHLDIIGMDSGKVIKRHTFYDVKNFGISGNGKYIAYTKDGKRLNIREVGTDTTSVAIWDKSLVEQRAFSNYMRGIYFNNAKRYAEAIKHFSAAVGQTYKAHNIYLLRGTAYMNSGNLDDAVKDFEKDYETNPERASLHLARTYSLKSDLDKSSAYLQEYMKSKSMTTLNDLENDSILINLQKDKRWAELTREYKKSESEKLADRSLERIKKKDLMGAMEFIDEAIKKDPTRAEWYKMRAELNMKLKQYDKAINDYKIRAELDSNTLAEVYVSIARAMAKKGELNRAAFMLSKSIEHDSAQFPYLLDIASLRYTAFQKQSALEAVNKYIDIIPNDPYGFYIRARIVEDATRSKEDIEHAISLIQDIGTPVPSEFMEFKRSLD
jgi:tetratricopeptide (TPR) repeat protein/WD40 repeat protein